MTLVPLTYLCTVALIALGISYIITASRFCFWIRALWVLLFGYVPFVRKLTALVLCPSCNAFWAGLVSAFLFGSGRWVALQCAVVSCVLTAVANGVAGLAPEPDRAENDIKLMWRRIRKHLRGE